MMSAPVLFMQAPDVDEPSAKRQAVMPAAQGDTQQWISWVTPQDLEIPQSEQGWYNDVIVQAYVDRELEIQQAEANSTGALRDVRSWFVVVWAR
jgi:hypothetical protein